MLERFLATLKRFGKVGAEARSKPYASVVVWGSKLHETAVAVYHEEQAPQSEIVVHHALISTLLTNLRTSHTVAAETCDPQYLQSHECQERGSIQSALLDPVRVADD